MTYKSEITYTVDIMILLMSEEPSTWLTKWPSVNRRFCEYNYTIVAMANA